MIDDGEIPFLDADPLDDRIVLDPVEKVLDADELAIERIAERLRKKGGRSAEQIEDMSVTLYNRICDEIRSGHASREKLEHAAQLFGEEPDGLLQRLQASE